MKSRYEKHLKRITNRSPVIAFSKEDIFEKKDLVYKAELNRFNQHERLDKTYSTINSYKSIKEEMLSNLMMFTDNYMFCGGHSFVYLLIPNNAGFYKIAEKETISKWAEAYWQKEDPENKRDWAYIDEDIHELFSYIMDKFEKYNKRFQSRH